MKYEAIKMAIDGKGGPKEIILADNNTIAAGNDDVLSVSFAPDTGLILISNIHKRTVNGEHITVTSNQTITSAEEIVGLNY